MNTEERISELEEKIEDLKGRLPKHSIQPHMLIELEEMEDELTRLKKEQ